MPWDRLQRWIRCSRTVGSRFPNRQGLTGWRQRDPQLQAARCGRRSRHICIGYLAVGRCVGKLVRVGEPQHLHVPPCVGPVRASSCFDDAGKSLDEVLRKLSGAGVRIDVGPCKVAILVTAGIRRNPGIVEYTGGQPCAMVHGYQTHRCNRTPPILPRRFHCRYGSEALMSAEMQLVDEQKHRSALHHEVLDSHGLPYRQKPTGRRRARTKSAFSRGDRSQWAERPSASDRITTARFSIDASTIRPPVRRPLRRAENSSPPTCLLGPGERNQGFRVENPRPHGDKP